MQSSKRSGLMVTVAALLVTVAMGYLQFYDERDARAQRAYMQGINWNQLDSAARHKSIPAMLKRGPVNAAFMDTAAS